MRLLLLHILHILLHLLLLLFLLDECTLELALLSAKLPRHDQAIMLLTKLNASVNFLTQQQKQQACETLGRLQVFNTSLLLQHRSPPPPLSPSPPPPPPPPPQSSSPFTFSSSILNATSQGQPVDKEESIATLPSLTSTDPVYVFIVTVSILAICSGTGSWAQISISIPNRY